MRIRTCATVIVAFLAFISLGLPDAVFGVAWASIRTAFDLPLDAIGALAITGVCGYFLSRSTSGRILGYMSVGTLLAISCLAPLAPGTLLRGCRLLVFTAAALIRGNWAPLLDCVGLAVNELLQTSLVEQKFERQQAMVGRQRIGEHALLDSVAAAHIYPIELVAADPLDAGRKSDV